MIKPILRVLVALPLFAIHISAQDYNLGYGEHDFQINANKWVKITLPNTQYYFNTTSSEVIRMRYDGGQEFQVLPQPKEFRQHNGQVIQTKWLKLNKGKSVPVDAPGAMPNSLLYLKAESGVANVHLSVTQPTSNPSSQGQQQGSAQNSRGFGGLLTIIVLGLTVYGGFKISKSGMEAKCPSCSKWWARQDLKSTEIDRRSYLDTVTRSDEHFDGEGGQAGYTHRREQVQFTKITYEDLHQCKYCNHQWTTTHWNQYEGGTL